MSRLRVGLSIFFYLVAAILLGYWVYVFIESQRFQQHWSRRLAQVEHREPTVVMPIDSVAVTDTVAWIDSLATADSVAVSDSVVARADSIAIASREELREAGVLGEIEIPRLGLSVIVVEGTDESQLKLGVGHIQGTAYPGQPGNVGIAGHRDTYFRKLKDLAHGDRIRFSTVDGVFNYAVDTIMIVTPERGDLLRATPSPMLTIVTCYPFYYIGHAPKRFVVRARQAHAKTSEAGLVVPSRGTSAARLRS